MKNLELLGKAVETYSHLLWQAVINVGGFAQSRSVRCKCNTARVVYCTSDSRSQVCFDPRGLFSEISKEVERLIAANLPIRVVEYKIRRLSEAFSGLCSNESYGLYLLDALYTERGILWMARDIPIDCEFVEIGKKGETDFICCPCSEEHLSSTRELKEFSATLSRPKKAGKNTYAFEFRLSAKCRA